MSDFQSWLARRTPTELGKIKVAIRQWPTTALDDLELLDGLSAPSVENLCHHFNHKEAAHDIIRALQSPPAPPPRQWVTHRRPEELKALTQLVRAGEEAYRAGTWNRLWSATTDREAELLELWDLSPAPMTSRRRALEILRPLKVYEHRANNFALAIGLLLVRAGYTEAHIALARRLYDVLCGVKAFNADYTIAAWAQCGLVPIKVQ